MCAAVWQVLPWVGGVCVLRHRTPLSVREMKTGSVGQFAQRDPVHVCLPSAFFLLLLMKQLSSFDSCIVSIPCQTP